ncbi:SIR2 family protein [Novipirellula sp.]|uniref:protein kinase domain-containing protein n=1 Tax=Novipirellula sp. TaxID=2795430 RepID=UPI003564AA00
MPFDISQPAFVRLKSLCAKKTNKLMFFTGAGLSKWCDLPLWGELKENLLDVLNKKASHFELQDREELRVASQMVRLERNPWRSFQLLRDKLGPQSFRASIRDSLVDSDELIPPDAYTLLWKLNTAGILNLNLDQLAYRAFSLVRPGKPIDHFAGRKCPNHAHLVKGNKPFVANLHGTLSDAESWVLTNEDLSSLLRKDGYKEFIQSCFLAHTVVFCGMSADDKAAGGFLDSLKSVGIDSGEHYWFTNRNDRTTDDWAQERNIEPILYSATNHDHSEFVEALKDLVDAKPLDDIASPVIASVPMLGLTDVDACYTPDDLESVDVDVLREYLNTRANKILTSESNDRYSDYFRFCEEYDAAIHRAWYAKPGTKHDTLFGYKLVKEIGEGAFGMIFEAENPIGESVAVKLLHESIRNKSDRLQAFRRGVASMQILESRNVHGIVPYKYAAEIPAFVVMDLIDGENLANAMEKYQLKKWGDVLAVAAKVIDILRRSHRLPEQVLHRDIRPQNIMVRNPWDEPEHWGVVMLDFDLSWNRDATEKSIEEPGSTNGYLAPEMMYRDQSVSTRSALVDSFGLGMTLFFMRTYRDPKPLEASHSDWGTSLGEYQDKYTFREWRSLPRRFFRLIEEATRPRQSDRIDVASIANEIDLLYLATQDASKIDNPSVWAEELASNSAQIPYTRDADSTDCRIRMGGLVVLISGRDLADEVVVEFRWSQVGNEQFASVKKWLPRACDQVNAEMKAGGWNGQIMNDGYFLDGSFRAEVSKLKRLRGRFQTALERAIASCQLR